MPLELELDPVELAPGDGEAEAGLSPVQSEPRIRSTASLATQLAELTGWTWAFGTTAGRALAAPASSAELSGMIVADDGATALPVPITWKPFWVSALPA